MVQAKRDEIVRLKSFRNQNEADGAFERIGALELEIATALRGESASLQRCFSLAQVQALYCEVCAVLSLCTGTKNARLPPLGAAQLSRPQLLQALAARGDFDAAMTLATRCDLSPAVLLQYLARGVAEELAAFYGENDVLPPHLVYKTSFLSRYEHKTDFGAVQSAMGVDVEKKLKNYLDAALDCAHFCMSTGTGVRGFATAAQLTGGVLSEFFTALLVCAARFARRQEIVNFVQRVCSEQFATALLEPTGGLRADVLWAAQAHGIEAFVRGVVNGAAGASAPILKNGPIQILKNGPAPAERQQGGHVYGQGIYGPGVKSAARVVRPGRGTFVQGAAGAV